MLKVNEIFYSIQGEGLHTGRAMTFIRLSGCNLNCAFCDTKHQEYTLMAEEDIMKEVCKNPSQHVCITGGEPLLQDLSKLLNLLGFFYKHLETNGTLPLPEGFNFDYICISPKEIDINLNILRASEIKVLCGPEGWEERVDFFRKRHPRVSLQPLSTYQIYTDRAIKYVKKHPGVRLSIQVHKLIGER